MRQKRAKAYRKLMHLYSQFFGFRQPYQLLIDPETCKMAIENKFDLVKQLSTVAQGEVKPMITQCCIHALYLSGKSNQPAVDLAKTFERRKCNHREAINPEDCLKDVVGDSNKHRYVIVAQSQPLRNHLRKIPATPLIHINRSVMILEPPSDATLRAKHLLEEKNLGATSSSDIKLVKETQPEEAPKKKKKGPKGPNPLSVKKKKVELVQPSKGSPSKLSSGQSMSVQSILGAKLQRRRGSEDGRQSQ
ncbi:PIN domain-like protein [Coprinopsis sp. MPI-PUGE-AT-0042]|nr:PIN domain-like protein [Coprinopsis sp. MPI-PUGE-AT-0042]